MIGATVLTVAVTFLRRRRIVGGWHFALVATAGLGLVSWVGMSDTVTSRLATLLNQDAWSIRGSRTGRTRWRQSLTSGGWGAGWERIATSTARINGSPLGLGLPCGEPIPGNAHRVWCSGARPVVDDHRPGGDCRLATVARRGGGAGGPSPSPGFLPSPARPSPISSIPDSIFQPT